VIAGKDVRSDWLEGIALLEAAHARATDGDRAAVEDLIADMKSAADAERALAAISHPELVELVSLLQEREVPTAYRQMLEVIADRPKARFSAWYEMFPRSQGTVPGKPSTFREAE